MYQQFIPSAETGERPNVLFIKDIPGHGKYEQHYNPCVVPRIYMRAKPAHDPDVARYRNNMSDKCPIEVEAARVRSEQHMEFGSPEMLAITPTCVSPECNAKYHWCPTCLLAPRCECRMYHMSPVLIPMFTMIGTVIETRWAIDQVSFVNRLTKIPCDDRYGTFVLAVKSIGRGSPSPFCESCTNKILEKDDELSWIYGRTYFEQAHYIWKLLDEFICDNCIATIDSFPCLHSGIKCPSMSQVLIRPRLIEYKPRHFGGKNNRESTQISSIRSAMISHKKESRADIEYEDYQHGIPRQDAWVRFWHAPNGPIKSLPEEN